MILRQQNFMSLASAEGLTHYFFENFFFLQEFREHLASRHEIGTGQTLSITLGDLCFFRRWMPSHGKLMRSNSPERIFEWGNPPQIQCHSDQRLNFPLNCPLEFRADYPINSLLNPPLNFPGNCPLNSTINSHQVTHSITH